MSGKPSIVKVAEALLEMSYFKNAAATSGAVHNYTRHEDAIQEKLTLNGFTKITLARGVLQRDYLDNLKRCPIKIGEFVSQPFGTHQNPDFLIRVNETTLLPLEAKSSENSNHPTFNSGGIHTDYLYVFSNKRYNKTTIFKGSEIISEAQNQLIKQHIEQAREADIILNLKLKQLDHTHRGVAYYTRPMIIQSGGSTYTDYFGHADCTMTEKNTLHWLENL